MRRRTRERQEPRENLEEMPDEKEARIEVLKSLAKLAALKRLKRPPHLGPKALHFEALKVKFCKNILCGAEFYPKSNHNEFCCEECRQIESELKEHRRSVKKILARREQAAKTAIMPK